jgi:hypothetical protein
MHSSKRQSLKWGASLGLSTYAGIGFAQKINVEGFLTCNLRYESYFGGTQASDNNWGEWKKFLPVGTPVKVFPATQVVSSGLGATRSMVRRNVWLFVSPNSQISFRNDYHRSMQEQELIGRFVSSDDPKPRLASYSSEVREAIGKGRVVIGMTREQVTMALGPPPANENPNPISTVLSYYWGSFDTLQLVFEPAGKLIEANGLPFVLADLLFDASK